MGPPDAEEELFLTDFLKRASPFGSLKTDRLRLLAERIRRHTFGQGDTIIREGETGSSCFLVRTGQVEVSQQEQGRQKVIATLGPGSLFGETALLTESPRNATVRTLEKTELLELKREDLMTVVGENRDLRLRMFEILSLRDRPIRKAGIEEHTTTSADGTTMLILANRSDGTYFRLSSEGRLIWQNLDGHQNLKDLTLLYLQEFGLFAPHSIAETLSRLVASGFAKSRTTRASFLLLPSWSHRILIGVQQLFEWKLMIRNVDPLVCRIHRFLHPLFSRSGQSLIGAITLFGLLLFFRNLPLQWSQMDRNGIPEGTLTVAVLLVLSGLFHESGHALATKAFGRKILGVGIGWNWITPILFVDTSDMWLARRWQRIVVSLAGPYTHLVLGGISSGLTLVFMGAEAQRNLWLFTAGSYLLFLMNLLPIFNFDGHYVWQELRERRKKSRSPV